jgi:hypothetical protein
MLPFLALGMSILMVSRIRYPHVLNQYLRGKKPFGHLIRTLLLLVFLYWYLQAALVLIFCGFAASSLVKGFYYKVFVSRFLTKWTPTGIREGSDLIPAAEGAPFSVLDERQTDEKNPNPENESSGRLCGG